MRGILRGSARDSLVHGIYPGEHFYPFRSRFARHHEIAGIPAEIRNSHPASIFHDDDDDDDDGDNEETRRASDADFSRRCTPDAERPG